MSIILNSENKNTLIEIGISVPEAIEQIINLGEIPEVYNVDDIFEFNPVVDSGLPITLSSSNPDIADVDGKTVVFIEQGVVTITFSVVGNLFYSPATLDLEITVNP